jgi:acetolactate synthase-1/2/3 large subunit
MPELTGMFSAPHESISCRDAAIQVAALLRNAKRPLIHLGNGVRGTDFESLIEHIPFVTARNANDLVGSDHPLCIGRPGTFAQRGANFAVQLCDVYLAIGTRLSLYQTGYNSKDYARNAKIIQVDIDQAELDKGTLRDPMKICADSGDFIHELIDALRWWGGPLDCADWIKRCQDLRDRYPVVLPEYAEHKGSVNAYHFIDVLSDLLTPEDIIVTDMGFAFQNTHQAFRVKKGQRLITNCGLAPMGWGLPAAIGAAIGTGRRVICITGEGGLMMNIQELATVAHHNLPIKLFVLNNGGYLTIKQTQELGFEGRLMGVNEETGLTFPKFADVAVAFGISYEQMARSEEVERTIEWILKCDWPFLCEIIADPNQAQAPRSINRRNPDGTMNPTALEDAFPYLPPEEIAEVMKLGE